MFYFLSSAIICLKTPNLASQLAYLKEYSHFSGAFLAVKIALSSYPYYNPYWNSLPVNLSNNELANGSPEVLTKNSNSLILISCAFTLGPASAPIPASDIFFTNNELFKKFIEAYLAA